MRDGLVDSRSTTLLARARGPSSIRAREEGGSCVFDRVMASNARGTSPNATQSSFARDWESFAREAGTQLETLTTQGVALARSASAAAQTSTHTFARSASETMAQTTQALGSLNAERVAWFLALSATSAFMYGLAFFLGVPTLVLAPAKFGLCFSFGSVASVCAVGALRGAGAQLKHMTSEERLPASAAMTATTMMTLHAAVLKHSYVMTVFWSVLQTVSVGYYQVSYFPYGAQGFRAVASASWQIVQPACGGCLRAMGYAASSSSSSSSSRSGGSSALPV